MATLFASARGVEWVLGFALLEALLLFAAWRRTGRGLRPRESLALLLPGTCLMLALREALAGRSGLAIAGWLLGALLTHLVDLSLRWRAAAIAGARR